MQLFRTTGGIILQKEDKCYIIDNRWDELINDDNLYGMLFHQVKNRIELDWDEVKILPPVDKQELWAAGVTYLRSRDARMEESKDAGGADFYSKVYNADRPELFFKALPHRIAAHKEEVFIRKDSKWNVPEPELTLFINSKGKIAAYTIGNDMSSRDIEGENPLYLPQAKVYDRSAAVGPCLYVTNEQISADTTIRINIKRGNNNAFEGAIQLNRMKRTLPELAQYLYRECTFDNGCFLMTGTGIVPPNDFTLQLHDEIEINIENIGTLKNTVAYKK